MAEEDFLQPLKLFAKWPADKQDTVIAWLESAKPRAGLNELGLDAFIELELRGFEPAIVLQALFENFYNAAEAAGETDESRQSIISTIVGPICDVPAVDQMRFGKLIERAIACKRTIEVSMKAGSVLWRQGRVFTNVGSVAQIRPVFDDKTLDILCQAVVHEFKIDYVEDGTSRSLTLLLDYYRLGLLKEAIERAELKEQLIKQIKSETITV